MRIQVERAIRRLKLFKVLSSTCFVTEIFDEILPVCAALVNRRADLIRDADVAELFCDIINDTFYFI